MTHSGTQFLFPKLVFNLFCDVHNKETILFLYPSANDETSNRLVIHLMNDTSKLINTGCLTAPKPSLGNIGNLTATQAALHYSHTGYPWYPCISIHQVFMTTDPWKIQQNFIAENTTCQTGHDSFWQPLQETTKCANTSITLVIWRNTNSQKRSFNFDFSLLEWHVCILQNSNIC